MQKKIERLFKVRHQDKLFVDTISFFGKRKLEIPLNDLTGIDRYPTRIFIKKGDKLDAKSISINVQKIGIDEFLTPWLSKDYRLYRYYSSRCEIALDKLRILENGKIVLTIDKQTNEFHLLPQSLKGKIEEIAAIVIEEKPPDSDGDVFRRPGLKLHTGVFYPCSEEFRIINYS